MSYLFHPVGLSSKTKVENDNVYGVYDRQYKHSDSKSLLLYRKDTLSDVGAVATATAQDISDGTAVTDMVALE